MGWEVCYGCRSMPDWAVNNFIDKYNSIVGDNLKIVREEGRITGGESASKIRMVENKGVSYVLRERLHRGKSSENNPWLGDCTDSFRVGVYHPDSIDVAKKLRNRFECWFNGIVTEIKRESSDLNDLFEKIESDVGDI